MHDEKIISIIYLISNKKNQLKRKSFKRTFTEFLLEIRIAAPFLIEIKAITNKNSGNADGNTHRSFRHHGHSNTQIPILR